VNMVDKIKKNLTDGCCNDFSYVKPAHNSLPSFCRLGKNIPFSLESE
jgi:hypothetical protein